MPNPLRTAFHRLGRWYVNRLSRQEHEAQQFRRVNERPIEYRFVFEQLAMHTPHRVLDVGTGTSALPSLMRQCGFVVTAIDNVRDYWQHGLDNRHYHIVDDDITRPRLDGGFDLVTCISTLEHIRDADAAVRGMFSLLKPGGLLVLTHPFNEQTYLPDVYRVPGAGYGSDLPYVCQVFSRAELQRWMHDNGATLVKQELWKVFSGEYWTFGDPVLPPVAARPDEPHQLTCLLLRKNG